MYFPGSERSTASASETLPRSRGLGPRRVPVLIREVRAGRGFRPSLAGLPAGEGNQVSPPKYGQTIACVPGDCQGKSCPSAQKRQNDQENGPFFVHNDENPGCFGAEGRLTENIRKENQFLRIHRLTYVRNCYRMEAPAGVTRRNLGCNRVTRLKCGEVQLRGRSGRKGATEFD